MYWCNIRQGSLSEYWQKHRAIKEFSVDLYFALTEKITVCEDGRLVVSLLDGTDVESEIE